MEAIAAIQAASPVALKPSLKSSSSLKKSVINAAIPIRSSSRSVFRQTTQRIPVKATVATEVPVSTELSTDCINTIRFLAIDAVEKANSGHPGLPMGCAPMSFVLFNEFMKFNPKNPYWVNRDRFVLSAGHGCMLQYALLHLAGYDSVTIDDIKQFRQVSDVCRFVSSIGFQVANEER